MKSSMFTAIAVLLLLCAAPPLAASSKLDPYFALHQRPIAQTSKALTLRARTSSEAASSLIEAFIKSSAPAKTREAIHALGGSVHTVVGRVLTASVPAHAVEELSSREDITFIEAAKPIHRTNDIALEEIAAAEVQKGLELPATFSGKGTIVGIIDTGIDSEHPDFLDAEGKNRVLYIWDQGENSGRKPAEIEDSYGTECNTDAIQNHQCSLLDPDGHGTHVSGIAAGSDQKYRGVAPEANIIVVRYDSTLDLESGYANAIFSTKICQAAYYIFTKADELGMPAVINLSLGTHLGAHDSSSLFEECLNGLVEGSAGRAIVAAAGNEYSTDPYFTGIHAGYEVSGTKATNFVIRKLSADGIYYIDLWGEPGSELSIGLAVHKGEPSKDVIAQSGLVAPGEKSSGDFLDGLIKYMINATETASPLNGKPHVGIRLILNHAIQNPEQYSFDLIVSGQGSFDAWLFPDKPSRTIQFTSTEGNRGMEWTFVSGDRKKCIAIPSTAKNIISVAGYTTRTQWTSNSLAWTFNHQELGALLSFSSAGPSANVAVTGQKPELAAPGGMIASALASTAEAESQTIMDDGLHYLQAGTSMAAPYVSGTIALMFQSNPNFTYKDVENFLILSAYQDEEVKQAPNDSWGYGKLDTLNAMKLAVSGTASGAFGENASLSPPTNSSSSSSSCSLMTNVGMHHASPLLDALLLLSGFFGIRLLRKRRYLS